MLLLLRLKLFSLTLRKLSFTDFLRMHWGRQPGQPLPQRQRRAAQRGHAHRNNQPEQVDIADHMGNNPQNNLRRVNRARNNVER